MRRLRIQHSLLISVAAIYALSLVGPSVVHASAILNASHVSAAASQVDATSSQAPDFAATVPPVAEAATAAAPQAQAAVASADSQVTDVQAAAPEAAEPTTVADTQTATVTPTQADLQTATVTPTQADLQTAAVTPTQADLQTATVTPTQVALQTATVTPTQAAAVAPTQVENHLPTWVQIVVASGSLYTDDSSSDQVLAHLPRHTFLRVLGGGTSRMQVQAYDESGSPGQTGWVSADQVLPSAPGIDWLVAAKSTTLWSGTDDSASSVRTIDAFSPLQKLDGPQLNRVQVNFYASDFSRVVASGWVDVSATGPALAPQVRVPGPTNPALANRVATSSDQQTTFLNDAAIAARQSAALTGVPASVTVAQAILESDWGRSTLAQNANNFFGMKAMGTLGNDGLVWMPTSEYDASGQLYQTTSAFRAYKSLTDSMMDHDRLLANASRYAGAMQVKADPKQFASRIAQEGYSTDPAYADKLVALMDRYNLYQLDA